MYTVLLITNSFWNFYNFRYSLIKGLVQAKYLPVLLAPFDSYENSFRQEGIQCIDLKLDRKNRQLFKELRLVLKLIYLIKKYRPHLILSFTIKPNLYAGLVCYLVRKSFIPNVTGLGTLFQQKTILSRLVSIFYFISFKKACCVFFQNKNDLDLFVKEGIVVTSKARLIPGSGVDLVKYKPLPISEKGFSFLFIGRFLIDKGIVEYYEAAKILKTKYPSIEFLLLGDLDPHNERSLDRKTLNAWIQSGIVKHLGFQTDVRPYLAACSCVVLPSYYREGLSRALLEAAGMGKPIITCDLPGCREIVEEGKNGFLCRPKDYQDLAQKMERLYLLPPAEKQKMGEASRKKAEAQYDEKYVIQAYLDAIAEYFASKSIQRIKP